GGGGGGGGWGGGGGGGGAGGGGGGGEGGGEGGGGGGGGGGGAGGGYHQQLRLVLHAGRGDIPGLCGDSRPEPLGQHKARTLSLRTAVQLPGLVRHLVLRRLRYRPAVLRRLSSRAAF